MNFTKLVEQAKSVETPAEILQSIGEKLMADTNHRLEYEITRSQDLSILNRFSQSLYVLAPGLPSYRFEVVVIYHGASPWPVEMQTYLSPDQVVVKSPSHLKTHLNLLLGRTSVQQTLAGIIAQADAEKSLAKNKRIRVIGF
jgi:hypothetical protein